MFKNTASQKLTVFAFDSTTNLPKTGDAANLTAYVSKDDGTVTVLGDTSATEMDSTNAAGYYVFDLTQAETNGDKLLFSAKSSTSNIVVMAMPGVVYTVPANFTAASIDSSGRVDVGKVAGTAQTARDLGGNLDAAVSTRLASSSYTAPDNSDITAIKAKTDNLPSDPADASVIAAAFAALGSPMQAGAHVQLATTQDQYEPAKAGDAMTLTSAYDAAKTAAQAGDAMALTSGERTTFATAIFAFVTEGAETFLGAVRLMRAALVGKSSGFPGSPATFRDQADSKARITVTHDADGNRSSITTDAT
jgi:hypothetical protein